MNVHVLMQSNDSDHVCGSCGTSASTCSADNKVPQLPQTWRHFTGQMTKAENVYTLHCRTINSSEYV